MVLILVAARVIPVIAWLPAFGAHALPWSLRIGMGAALAAWFSFGFAEAENPRAIASIDTLNLDGAANFLHVAMMGVGELAIGITLAWLASLFFAAIEMAGRLADAARRADGGGLLAPLSAEGGDEATPLSALYVLLAVLVFAELGGPAHIVAALVRSYEILPLGGGAARGLDDGFISLVAQTMAGSVEVAVGLAAPVLIAIWLADLVLAVAARLAGTGPEIGLMHSTAAPIVGLGIVLLSLGMLRAGIEGWLLRIPQFLLRTAQLWSHG